MTKKQEQTELKKIIQISEIHESTQRLKKLLERYKKNEQVKGDAYSVQLEFIKIRQKIDSLQHQLEDAIKFSEIWEAK